MVEAEELGLGGTAGVGDQQHQPASDLGARSLRLSVRLWCLAALLLIAVLAVPGSASASTTASAWGMGREGGLGDGKTAEEGGVIESEVPIQVAGLSGVVQVAGGTELGVALLENGTVWTWGADLSGDLGTGSTGAKTATPVEVPGLSGVIAVAAHSSTVMALLANGIVMAWGNNNEGQLGNGTTTNSSSPVKVSGLSNVVAISEAGDFSLALRQDGTVMAWGSNEYGQLGNGGTTNSSVPVEVSGLTDATAIADGGLFSFALTSSGKVLAWGANYNGQLGTGTTSGPESCEEVACSLKPVQVSELSEVKAIGAGNGWGMAVLDSGSVKAWGENNQGELGNGTTTNSDVPVSVSSISNAVAVTGGYEFSLALLADGTVKSWGLNGNCQLGDGSCGGK